MSSDVASPSTPPLTLEWLPGRYAVCRLDPDQSIPSWARLSDAAASLLSITRTNRELSIVIDQSLIPTDAKIRAERDFVALRIVGVLDFNLVGILAKLTSALAAAKVPVFVISTFESDLLLVNSSHQGEGTIALQSVATIKPRIRCVIE